MNPTISVNLAFLGVVVHSRGSHVMRATIAVITHDLLILGQLHSQTSEIRTPHFRSDQLLCRTDSNDIKLRQPPIQCNLIHPEFVFFI